MAKIELLNHIKAISELTNDEKMTGFLTSGCMDELKATLDQLTEKYVSVYC